MCDGIKNVYRKDKPKKQKQSFTKSTLDRDVRLAEVIVPYFGERDGAIDMAPRQLPVGLVLRLSHGAGIRAGRVAGRAIGFGCEIRCWYG